jgi:hypothetical protein
MSKHTTGPWSVGKVSHKKQRVDIDSLHADQTVGHQTWRGLARAYGCKDMPAEGTAAMLANARLIAAAPELLEALQELRYAATDKAEQMADAAITKATGERT